MTMPTKILNNAREAPLTGTAKTRRKFDQLNRANAMAGEIGTETELRKESNLSNRTIRLSDLSMKRYGWVALVLAWGIFLTGCVPSLSPIYTDKDLISDKNLEGTFTEGETDQWTFTKIGPREYRLV
ncbi:MAG: hypothetical protein SFY81_04615, partial [Verrucomicrobiota bacterium]|nr:hypothetical protein [Verrucomicrobiota bacterium]